MYSRNVPSIKFGNFFFFIIQSATTLPPIPLQKNDESWGELPPAPTLYWGKENVKDGNATWWNCRTIIRFYFCNVLPGVKLKWKMHEESTTAKVIKYDVYYYREVPEKKYDYDVWKQFTRVTTQFLLARTVSILIFYCFCKQAELLKYALRWFFYFSVQAWRTISLYCESYRRTRTLWSIQWSNHFVFAYLVMSTNICPHYFVYELKKCISKKWRFIFVDAGSFIIK